jgi:large subunit ribosomal protein L3
VEDAEAYQAGAALDVTMFEVGDRVDVIGRSIGRGTIGPIKRHNTHRGPESHGSMYHRRPGSMGASSFPSRTFKGKKLAGHMGDERVTMRNLEVLMVDREKNLVVVRGSIPGHANGYVMIRKTVGRKKSGGE